MTEQYHVIFIRMQAMYIPRVYGAHLILTDSKFLKAGKQRYAPLEAVYEFKRPFVKMRVHMTDAAQLDTYRSAVVFYFYISDIHENILK